MDSETKEILEEQKEIYALTSQRGWSIIHSKFVEKIAQLRDAFELDDTDEKKMFIDLQARKVSAHILKTFLEDIEGTTPQVQENNQAFDQAHILRVEK